MILILSALAAEPRPQDVWDLAAVYADVPTWEAALTQSQRDAEALSQACRGKVATQLRPCLEQRFALQRLVSRVYTYASNHANTDLNNAEWQGRSQTAQGAYVRFEEAASFFAPEIQAMGGPSVESAIAADAGLLPFDHFLRSAIVDAPHTLDARGEALLAATGGLRMEPYTIQSILVSAELPWPEVTLSDGTQARLDPSGWSEYRGTTNRDDRVKVFDAFYGALKAYEGTLGATLNAGVSGNWFAAKARGYPTSVAAAIDGDHVPAAVYDTLVAQTNANLPTLHRYLKLRARMLGVSDLAYSDIYPTLVKSDRVWSVDEASRMTIEATKPLGPVYAAALAEGLAGRWMHVYPQKGKRGGAYMDGGAYDVHPFILLNHNDDYESVSTFAHEWGHAIHSVLSARNQPYPKADYATFIAEIASTTNEALLLQTVLKQAKTDEDRLYFLGSQLEGLRGTYFRQAQFAEFEREIHSRVERGEPLTGETLSAIYLEILKRYYGHDQGVTRISDRDAMEWAYIPHFYYNFYVYQYATSMAASSQFAADILGKKPGALDRYLTLLSAGGSRDPYVLLKTAGVDLATAAPYDALATQMNAIMDQMEAILNKKPGRKK